MLRMDFPRSFIAFGVCLATLLSLPAGTVCAQFEPAADAQLVPGAEAGADALSFQSASTVLTSPSEMEAVLQRLADVESRLKLRDDADKKAESDKKKKFVVRPFGRIQLDAMSFNQDADNRATVGNAANGVDFRRARIGIEGEGFDVFFYRFDVGFANFDPSTSTRPTIFDAYLDTQHVPFFGNIRAGHFREPFSLERLDSTNDLPFLERSTIVNSIVPNRNIGLMAFDWNEDQTATWAYGVFAENTNEFGEDYHDRTGIAATARATFLPWINEDASEFLHLGTSYSYRRLGTRTRRFQTIPEGGIRQGLTHTPSFIDTGTGANLIVLDDYHVAGFEACSMMGPLSVQGEYVFLAGDQANGNNLFLNGGYVEAMYWLTGEHRNYNRKQGNFGAVTPKTGFRCKDENGCTTCGLGAWELTSRLSYIDLNSHNVQGGRMTDITLGVNWYLAPRVRLMFNYVHAFLDRGGLSSNADIFGTRMQYVF